MSASDRPGRGEHQSAVGGAEGARTAVPAPASMGLVADASLRRIDEGRVLVGGSPLRVVRLTPAGAGAVDRWLAGDPVGDSTAGQALARRLLDGGLVQPAWRDVVGRWTAADVTVVVPTFGRPGGVERTLRSMATASERSSPAEVVVVDDGSPPEEAAVLRSIAREGGASLATRHRNGGPGLARNTGLDRVGSPLVAFVDAEVVPEPGWLDRLLVHFDDPAVGAVAPRVLPAGDRSSVRGGYEALRSPLDLGPRPARVAPRTRVAYVPTTALVVRLDALAAVGRFDPALRHGEDVDLVWRLVEAGWTVRYEPSATVTHPVRSTWPAWVAQRMAYGASAAPLAERHPGALAPVSVSAWSASSWALAAVGHPVVGAAVAGVAASRLPRRLGGLRHPWGEGLRLAGGGTWAAWRPLAGAVTRSWWPATLAAAAVSRRARRVALAAALIPPLVDWWQGERSVDPARYVALRLADDLAYGAGVWAGCLRARSAAALAPDLSSWPGHRRAVERD